LKKRERPPRQSNCLLEGSRQQTIMKS
jgi:hypothetical protein